MERYVHPSDRRARREAMGRFRGVLMIEGVVVPVRKAEGPRGKSPPLQILAAVRLEGFEPPTPGLGTVLLFLYQYQIPIDSGFAVAHRFRLGSSRAHN